MGSRDVWLIGNAANVDISICYYMHALYTNQLIYLHLFERLSIKS